jgi:L-fuconolactonase
LAVDADRSATEPIIEPDLPIVDPHHHLWFVNAAARAAMAGVDNPYYHVRRAKPRYLFDELLADLNSGHNIRATVYAECHSMYRRGGPGAMRSVGEVEFVNGVAAMSASGAFGDIKVCAGIVGNADLMLGEAVEAVLEAQVQAGGGRFRGIRHVTTSDPDAALANCGGANPPHILLDTAFRAGFRRLNEMGLSFDAYLFEPQLPELVDLARAFPEAPIILNHTGTPLSYGLYAGTREMRFPIWRRSIQALAACENVVVKLGGLGMPICGFPSFLASPPATSEQLAAEWKPYIETCIEAFGADRCMFESNYPTESGSGDYPTLWNAFKRLAAQASTDEKTALFSGVATRVYRLPP